jgi:hypothetical protein
MADASDVEVALVSAVTTALYPNGSTAPSVPGADCRIYRGWPNSAALDSDLTAGTINVTVFPSGGNPRTTTRYMERWNDQTPGQVTLTASVSNGSVTFNGTVAQGQVAGILVNGVSYAYRVQSADSPALVAANLGAMIRANMIVQVSGSTLTIAGAGDLLARVVADSTVQKEVRRQEQVFRVTCWCPTPTTRDATAIAIDQAMSGVRFLSLPDGGTGRMTYSGTTVYDQSQNARLYRRDLNYLVEYPTTITSSNPSMLFGELVLNSNSIIT